MKKVCFLVFLVLFSLLNALEFQKNILIISSYCEDYKWERDITQSIENKIHTYSDQINIFKEHLDVTRTNYSSQDFTNYLSSKYSNVYFEVIIACDEEALKYINENYESQFLGRPVVFCGILNFNPNKMSSQLRYTGVNERIDFEETTDLMIKLYPEVKKVYVYGDKSALYEINKLTLMALIPKYNKRLTFHFINQLDILQLKAHCSQLDNGSIIYVISSIRNLDHKPVLGIEKSFSTLYESSQVPIISFWDNGIGRGILGGKLVVASEQGSKAGDLVIEILKGKPLKDLPVIMNSPNIFMFDHEVLKKYRINKRQLPKSSLIINRPKSFYEINKGWFWLLSLVLLVLILVTVLLSFQIRKRIMAESALKEHLLFLNKFIDTIPNPVFYKQLSGRFVLCNHALELLLDKTHNEIIGKTSDDIFDKELSLLNNNYDALLLEEENDLLTYEFELVSSKGFIRNVLITKTTIRGVDGRISGILGVVQDITENKKTEELVKKQFIDLEEKNKEMESFIYTVSHDLKSPIITIKGFLSFLNIDFINDEKEKFTGDFEKIIQATDKMQFLLEDLLQLSRIGRVANPPENFNMINLIESLIQYLQGIIKSSGAIIEYPKELPEVYADKNRIREIWQNLIENSIKYCSKDKKPHVKITVEYENNNAIYCITDNGIGIDKKFHSKVFDLFEKLDPNTPGTGIGLARVKKIIEMYNGKIWIDHSETNKGTGIKFFINPV